MIKKENKHKKISKLNLWLFHYLNENSPDTFLNATGSAKAAGYKASDDNGFGCIGYKNYRKVQNKIVEWIDGVGLSEDRLKAKVLSLLNAKETKFFAKGGKVVDQKEVDALETQRKALDMALKVKGSYAAVKREVSGPDGCPVQLSEQVAGLIDDIIRDESICSK